MKSHSVLVFIICVFSDADWVFTQENEALVIVESIQSNPREDLPGLPNIAEELNGRIIYPDMTAENGLRIEYSYLCPPQTTKAKGYVKKISAETPEFSYCLEKNTSMDKPVKCQDEVKPVLIENRNWQQSNTRCDRLPDRKTYHFGFILRTLYLYTTGRITIFSLYDVCFDTKKSKILWAKHRVATGFMLQKPGLPSQRIQLPDEYSKEHYELPKEMFSNISKEYKNQKEDSLYKMIPQMMVPHEDFALRIWKKTTIHYANTAPLWENLVPLMKVINDGIRRAGTIVNLQTYKTDTLLFDSLDIYTVAYSHTFSAKLEAWAEANKDTISKKDLFGWNIWCKFIHHEDKKKGVMIYLHNLPDLPPRKSDLTGYLESEKSLQNTECEKTVSCDFRKWSEEFVELSDDILSYAYCCKVTNEKIQELFNITLEDELDLLDINKIINEDSI